MNANTDPGPSLIVVIAPEAAQPDPEVVDPAESAATFLFHTATDLHFACNECEAGWCRGRACIHGEGFGNLGPHLEAATRLRIHVPVRWEGALPMMEKLLKNLKAFRSPLNRVAIGIRESRISLSDEFSGGERAELLAAHILLCETMNWAAPE